MKYFDRIQLTTIQTIYKFLTLDLVTSISWHEFQKRHVLQFFSILYDFMGVHGSAKLIQTSFTSEFEIWVYLKGYHLEI